MNSDDVWKKQASATANDAVSAIQSGAKIFVHGAAATPTPLLKALAQRDDLEQVTLYHLHTDGPWPFKTPEQLERFHSVALFAGPHHRKLIAQGYADFMPIFLADIPRFLSAERLDVALVQLSLPDRHGFCTLGTSVDTAMAAVESASLVIAEINTQMPRTHGRTALHISQVDAFITTDRPIYEHTPAPETEVTARIGEQIAALVDDGSTLQTGIGAIPDAVLRRLGDKHELGVHTEMFSDGVFDLFEVGVITNRKKTVHAGRLVTSFVTGTRRLYDFIDDNPVVEFHPCNRTNDTAHIGRNPKVVAINSALEVDLTGQVCADSIGHRIYSGIGGQMDFIRGAALSEGGKPIIALPSTAARGTISRICATLKPGGGVVTTRGHVHW
ncbi:MAG: acetyl-CoA hydrolase/transferase C-terminal domain-containing protein, partial [Myxococcota bacterium]